MKLKVSKAKAEQALLELKKVGRVSFDGSSGSFSAKGVDGTFSYDEQSEILTIRITDKPWLVSESYVEDEIKKYFS